MQQSIRGKILFVTLAALLVQLSVVFVLVDSTLPLTVVLAIAFGISLAFLLVALRVFYGPIEELVSALQTGVSSFRDKDFSVRIHKSRNDELGSIVDTYNEMANVLCEERISLFQREMLLDTIIQSTPVSILLTDSRDFIVYANDNAQTLFKQTQKLDGKRFGSIVNHLPTELREATSLMQNGLVNLTMDNERIAYYVHCQVFDLNSREHKLYLFKNLTVEMSRQEIDLWKNAIRLISHELNNSLAPITSMANSAQKIINSQSNQELLPELIETIQLRTKRLKEFLVEYADFARLPAPKLETVDLAEFLKHVSKVCPFNVEGELPKTSINIDPAQMEQVLINLYKNAVESGSPAKDIQLDVSCSLAYITFAVLDRGPGMTEQQLQKALLPFFSTKQTGSGLGLSLCNEIVTAHNGSLRIQNREGKGLSIKLVLPNQAKD